MKEIVEDSKMDFKEIAEKTKKLEDELGISMDDILNKLTQELGEFNDAIQKYRGRYCRRKVSLDDIKEEVGDVIFNIISVCNRLGIDPNELSKYAETTLKSFEERKDEYSSAMGVK